MARVDDLRRIRSDLREAVDRLDALIREEETREGEVAAGLPPRRPATRLR